MRRATLLSVAVTVVVIVLMDWLPTPLNQNILRTAPAERLPGTLIHASMGVGIFVANLAGRRWLIFAGGVWYSIVLVSAILNWWVPYLFGIYPGEIALDTYLEEYSANLTLLPRLFGNPVVPDVQHSLIHLSVLLSCSLSWIAFHRLGRQRLTQRPRKSDLGASHAS